MAKTKSNKQNFSLIALFLIIPAFVLAVAAYKIMTPKEEYVYAKVKVSQGLWWASTTKSNIWFAKAIKVGDVEQNLLGKPVAEVTRVQYYPYPVENQPYEDKFDIYLSIKLTADYNKKSGKIIFKRSPVAVGAPIEFEFPSAQVTGIVIEISETEFEEIYSEKTVYLTKRFAYPWEFNEIKLGDKYFDGENIVFEVLVKDQSNTTVIASDSYGNITPLTRDATRYITIVARIKVKERNGQFIFGEEKLLIPGSPFEITTPNFNYRGFVVSCIK